MAIGGAVRPSQAVPGHLALSPVMGQPNARPLPDQRPSGYQGPARGTGGSFWTTFHLDSTTLTNMQ